MRPMRRWRQALTRRCRPGFPEVMAAEIDGAWDRLRMVEPAAELVTGKQAKEPAGGG